ncbi:MAG: hypothetical protein B6244_04040 [Candidatus Cloacimonetes bacterium 4572_55]|nr:MAG: hypothetical protein B6244_04040 [Candidatus Cloacimonetes bacterium 4572_55]
MPISIEDLKAKLDLTIDDQKRTNALIVQGKDEEALEYLLQKLQIRRLAEHPSDQKLKISSIHKLLADVYKQKRNFEAAFFHLEKHLAFSDENSVTRQSSQVMLKMEEAQKEMRKYQSENEKLRARIKENRHIEEKTLRKLKKAIETVEVGVTIIDTNNKIIFTNPAEAKMHGFLVEEVIGKPSSIFGRPRARRKMKKSEFKRPNTWLRETINVRKDGSMFPVQLISSAVTDFDGTPIGMVTVCEDITKRKNAEKQLRKKNKELAHMLSYLEKLNNEKNELMGIVSHDLKNPLTSILGIVDLLKTYNIDDFSPKEIEQYLAEIEIHSERMVDLVTNLLDVNRLESGKMQFNLTCFDLNQIVNDLINQYQPRAQIKSIQFNYPYSLSEKIWAYGDHKATIQVLDNLISNAIKFSPSHKKIHIRLDKKNGTVRFQVKDEGQGLTKQDMDGLFVKFSRLSATPTGNEHSTGLGLSIARKLVDGMNCRIWAESKGKNKGATFYVEFPRLNCE